MEGIDNEVQRQIKRAERKNDMTQEQLAKVSGVSPRTIQRYECGTSRPRLDAAEKLAKALNISVDQLLGTMVCSLLRLRSSTAHEVPNKRNSSQMK